MAHPRRVALRPFFITLVALHLLQGANEKLGAQPPAPADAVQLDARLTGLNAELAALPQATRRLPQYADAAVCAKATDWILRHNEFYKPKYVAAAHRTLDIGFARAQSLRSGTANWGQAPGATPLAYISQVDRSLQPYAVTLPANYQPGNEQRWPLYVVLHGRNATLTESSFIAEFEGKTPPDLQTWIQLDVFGRTNNAYRWSGETDVFEAIADVSRRYRIDDRRVTLWGFSMGGAGAWHLGLQHPSRWASVGAGAGFVDFYKYQKRSEHLPDPQHALLGIYDTVGYAQNLHNVPFITYGGEEDPQLQSSLIMKELAGQLDVPLASLVGPKMGHKFDPVSLAQFMAFLGEHNLRGRPSYPGNREIRFSTHTLKYQRCEWVRIEEQILPFAESTVESTLGDEGLLSISTQNVAALAIDRGAADQVSLDGGEPVALATAAEGSLPDVYFINTGDGWDLLDYDESVSFEDNPEHRKRHNLQGPIDDAFMEPFICVRGTGTPWTWQHQAYVDYSLARFSAEHDKYLRGQIPIVTDQQLTETDLKERHLVLFGDPGSNSLIAQVIARLPIRWTKTELEVDGKTYNPGQHAVALIYPNPLNPKKYVVINSGMTMHAQDFKSSNAWLFPKLGDVAVIKFKPDGRGTFQEEVLWSALFNSGWEFNSR